MFDLKKYLQKGLPARKTKNLLRNSILIEMMRQEYKDAKELETDCKTLHWIEQEAAQKVNLKLEK